MNNAKFAIDFVDEQFEEEKAPLIRQRLEEISRIIDSMQRIADNEDWKVLKILIFDELVATLEARQKSEASKKPIDTDELQRINGQLIWAKRYSDLYKLIDVYKLELTSLKDKLNANN